MNDAKIKKMDLLAVASITSRTINAGKVESILVRLNLTMCKDKIDLNCLALMASYSLLFSSTKNIGVILNSFIVARNKFLKHGINQFGTICQLN